MNSEIVRTVSTLKIFLFGDGNGIYDIGVINSDGSRKPNKLVLK
jgi:hypothetical protein